MKIYSYEIKKNLVDYSLHRLQNRSIVLGLQAYCGIYCMRCESTHLVYIFLCDSIRKIDYITQYKIVIRTNINIFTILFFVYLFILIQNKNKKLKL